MKVSPAIQGALIGITVVVGARLFEFVEQRGADVTAFTCGALFVAVVFMSVTVRRLSKRLEALEGGGSTRPREDVRPASAA